MSVRQNNPVRRATGSGAGAGAGAGAGVGEGDIQLTVEDNFIEHDDTESLWLSAPRAVMVLTSLIFLLFGCIMTGFAGFALKNKGAYTDLIPENGLHLAVATGFFLALVACLGIYAALQMKKPILLIYSLIALATVVVEAAAAGVVMKFASDLASSSYNNPSNSAVTTRVYNAINTTYDSCCLGRLPGATAAERYSAYNDTTCKVLPAHLKDANTTCATRQAFAEAIVAEVQSLVKPVGLICLIFAVPQFLALCASCILFCRHDDDIDEEDDVHSHLRPIAKDEKEKDVEAWPFVLVFPKKSLERTDNYSLTSMVARLHRAGLETCLFKSTDGDEIFCRLKSSRERLEQEADRIEYTMRFDSDVLENRDLGLNEHVRAPLIEEQQRDVQAENEDRAHISVSLRISNDGMPSNYHPYAFIHGPFKLLPNRAELNRMPEHRAKLARSRHRLYKLDRLTRMKFREIDVLKLLMSIIEAPTTAVPPGAGMALDHLYHKKIISEFFPLHHKREKKLLMRKWYRWCSNPWRQPLHHIRAYFGEKVALYFTFLSHYTKWLLAPAFIGIVVYVHQRAADTATVSELPFYGIFIALWATFFLEVWKRENAKTNMMWGMVGYEKTEESRPEYNERSVEIPGPRDGLPYHYTNPRWHRGKIVISATFVGFMIAVVLVCVVSIFALRAVMVRADVQYANYIVAIINAVQIHALNFVYAKLAVVLNDWENHRTDTLYEDNLIAKTFLFQFINSYFNLFYVAFIKSHVQYIEGQTETCRLNSDGVPDCLSDLNNQLGTIFVTRLILGNFTEIAVPWLKAWWAGRGKKSGDGQPLVEPSQAEEENELEDYTTFSDYAEVIIQFGYVTLFVVAFPLAPLLAFISNYVELRIDALKLLTRCCRPEPAGAEDIGTWYPILEILGLVAVMTNVGVVIFSAATPAFNITNPTTQVWTFLIIEHVVFSIKYLIDVFIPDQPSDVLLQMSRQEYLVAKHIEDVEDDVVTKAEIKSTQPGVARDAQLRIHDREPDHAR